MAIVYEFLFSDAKDGWEWACNTCEHFYSFVDLCKYDFVVHHFFARQIAEFALPFFASTQFLLSTKYAERYTTPVEFSLAGGEISSGQMLALTAEEGAEVFLPWMGPRLLLRITCIKIQLPWILPKPFERLTLQMVSYPQS